MTRSFWPGWCTQRVGTDRFNPGSLTFGGITVCRTAVEPEIKNEAEQRQIDGDIRTVEDREINRDECQKINHIPQSPAVDSIAEGAPKQEGERQGLPERNDPVTTDPDRHADTDRKAENTEKIGESGEETEGGSGVVNQLQRKKSGDERIDRSTTQQLRCSRFADLIDEENDGGDQQNVAPFQNPGHGSIRSRRRSSTDNSPAAMHRRS